MPLFRFKSTESKKSKAPPKKASSMNNIYNDYGSPPEAQSQQNPSQKKKGGTLYDFLNDEQNQIQSQWRERRISGSGSEAQEAKIKTLESKNKELNDENNLLKLKVELLLDMLAQKTAEAEYQKQDLDQMKRILMNQK